MTGWPAVLFLPVIQMFKIAVICDIGVMDNEAIDNVLVVYWLWCWEISLLSCMM